MTKILNIGSLNVDYVYKVPYAFTWGETIESTSLQVYPGGKGLNQSIALARAGSRLEHAGAIGASDGQLLLDTLQADAVGTGKLLQLPLPSGHAIIPVDPQARNMIVLFGGANKAVTEEHVRDFLHDYGTGDYLLLQNEVSELHTCLTTAAAQGVKSVLNFAPANIPSPAPQFELVDTLITNEHELINLLRYYRIIDDKVLAELEAWQRYVNQCLFVQTALFVPSSQLSGTQATQVNQLLTKLYPELTHELLSHAEVVDPQEQLTLLLQALLQLLPEIHAQASETFTQRLRQSVDPQYILPTVMEARVALLQANGYSHLANLLQTKYQALCTELAQGDEETRVSHLNQQFQQLQQQGKLAAHNLSWAQLKGLLAFAGTQVGNQALSQLSTALEQGTTYQVAKPDFTQDTSLRDPEFPPLSNDFRERVLCYSAPLAVKLACNGDFAAHVASTPFYNLEGKQEFSYAGTKAHYQAITGHDFSTAPIPFWARSTNPLLSRNTQQAFPSLLSTLLPANQEPSYLQDVAATVFESMGVFSVYSYLVELLSLYLPNTNLITTLGKYGVVSKRAYVQAPQIGCTSICAYKIKPVDTTAAGDTFVGYFLHFYSQQRQFTTAIALAQGASALTCQREGASVSIPTLSEVQQTTHQRWTLPEVLMYLVAELQN